MLINDEGKFWTKLLIKIKLLIFDLISKYNEIINFKTGVYVENLQENRFNWSTRISNN